MSISFILPTYNERENITKIIKQINHICKINQINYEIIVIDDNSNDGTIQEINFLRKQQKELCLMVRKHIMGVGSAHLEGYNQAKGDLIISMDADLSHSPHNIINFVNKINEGYDVVIGSRFLESGGSKQNLLRRTLSKLINIYFSKSLGISLKDFTSGYRAIKKESWERIKDLKFSKKNLFLVECIYYFNKEKRKIAEIPIIFEKREQGTSKFKIFNVFLKALLLPIALKFSGRFNYIKSLK